MDLLHSKQQTKHDTTHALPVIRQFQRDNAKDSLIDDISTFEGKAGLYFDWILKLENIAAETK